MLSHCLCSPAEPSRLPVALDQTHRLRFGTEGLHAAVGPGYDRLNCLVLSAAQALARISNPISRVFVVSHNTKTDSTKFAVLIADVFRIHGAQDQLFSRPFPTPSIALAVRSLQAVLSLCVTASHNPSQDNWLKVFWSDGIQIRPDV